MLRYCDATGRRRCPSIERRICAVLVFCGQVRYAKDPITLQEFEVLQAEFSAFKHQAHDIYWAWVIAMFAVFVWLVLATANVL